MQMVMPSGPCPAKIMLVGDAPGQQEIAQNMPFVGMAGQELGRMLSEAGIQQNQCFSTNVVRILPPGGKADAFIALKKKDISPRHVQIRDKMCLPVMVEGIELLKREIEMCRPNVIIAFGNVSLWALTGNWGITSWRGSTLQTDLELNLDYKPKVVPVITPGQILRQWSWRQIAVHDLKRAKTAAATQELIPPDYDFLIQPDFGQVMSVLYRLQKEVEKGPFRLACDIETRVGHITCLGVGWSKSEAMCIPFLSTDKEVNYWPLEQETAIVFALYKLLTHKNCLVLGQNFHYDAQYIIKYFLFSPNLHQDTMFSQHSCFSNMQKGLDFLSSMYCDFHAYWKAEGKEWDPSRPPRENWTYNCKDCVITYEVAEELLKVVKVMKLVGVHNFQQSLYQPVLDTMVTGLRVDVQRRAAFAMTLMDEIAKREQYFIDVLGHPLNPRSGPQMQKLFYGDLKQKVVKKRGTGAISCDGEALATVAAREPLLKPLIQAITEYRTLGVFFSTFISAPLGSDGRLRCSFKVTGTETYRFASSKDAFGSGLNLQNIPKGGEESEELELPNIRTIFIPDPGKTFFDIDLDSADLRIVCWEADIKEMKAMILEGKKVYVEVAKEYLKDPTITKHHKMYKTFKGLCHGTNYLGTAKGLAQRLGLGVHETETIQKWYYGKFPELKKWQDDLVDQVFKRRMVENVLGYRTYFFDRLHGTIMNQAVAWIPQSTVACIINRGYRNIFDNLKEVQVLLQVHDSLAGQFDTQKKEWAVRRIIEECEIELPYSDPMVVPVDIVTSTKSWGDCK